MIETVVCYSNQSYLTEYTGKELTFIQQYIVHYLIRFRNVLYCSLKALVTESCQCHKIRLVN